MKKREAVEATRVEAAGSEAGAMVAKAGVVGVVAG